MTSFLNLVGRQMTFRVEIPSASGLPAKLCKDVFVTYKLDYDKASKYQTPAFEGKTPNPTFNYKKVHQIDMVTGGILDYLKNQRICFKVWAYPDMAAAKAEAKTEMVEAKKEEVQKEQEVVAAAEVANTTEVPAVKTIVATDKEKTEPELVKKSGCCTLF